MSLTPWRPSTGLDRFFDQGDWFMPVFPKPLHVQPALDLRETEKEVVCDLEAPGFSPEKIDISVKDGYLRIKGEMQEKVEEKEKGYWHKEIRRGSFERLVRIPVPVDEKNISASYEKGVLHVVMPKSQEKKSEIKIQVKGK